MKKVLSRDFQKYFFDLFLHLPESFLVLINIFFFFFAIFDSQSGSLLFADPFADWLAWVSIGVFGSFLLWFLMRIAFSPIALLVMNSDKEYYDRLIAQSLNKKAFPPQEKKHPINEKTVTQSSSSKVFQSGAPASVDENPQSPFDWQCSCGHYNNEFIEVCEVCKKPKQNK